MICLSSYKLLALCQPRYFGLSSTGITYKSGSATSSSYSSGSYQSSDRYGGLGGTGSDKFRDSYKDRDQHDEDKFDKKSSSRSRRGVTSENRESSSKKGSAHYGSRYLLITVHDRLQILKLTIFYTLRLKLTPEKG